MARYSKGMNGPVSGKVGTIVGATWKGIPYQRSLPKVNPNRRRSTKEKANQNKFGFASRWFSPLKEFLQVSMAHYPRPMTWLNVAYTLNHHLFLPADGTFVPDYANLQLSYGDLPELESPVLEVSGAEIRLSWDKGADSNRSDQVAMIIYMPDERLYDGFIGRATRGEGQCTYTHKLGPGGAAYVYIFLTSSDRKRVSASRFMGGLAL